MIWLFILLFHCANTRAVLDAYPVANTTTWQVVDLGYAKYQTNVSLRPGVISFLGIRYAASPAGLMRWTRPRRPDTVHQMQNATSQPDQCPQTGFGLSPTTPFRRTEETGISEDCLFLSVHTPAVIDNTHKASGLPVVVWIHGGGYGLGGNILYPTQDFVAESDNNIIAVGIQYRLGLYGFLPGQEVKNHGVLNAGLLDQEFALEWVRQHIHSFGGDPSRVTIWGSSAGAGAVLQHIVAHNGRTEPQLFQNAIMSSPYLPFQYKYDDSIPEALYNEVVSRSGCKNSRDTVACLRSIDFGTLSRVNADISAANFVGVFTFVPVVDGTFVTERPTEILREGIINGKRFLIISNANEGAEFINQTVLGPVNYTLSQYATQLFPQLLQDDINRIVQRYSASGEGTAALDQAAEVMGDSIFTCPGYYALEAFGSRAWKGFFAIPPALHGLDLSYEFLSFIPPPTFTNIDFQHAFSQAMMSLIIFSDPNVHFDSSNITPNWRNWGDSNTEMLFNKTESDLPDVRVIPTSSDLLNNCEFWETLTPFIAQ